MAKKRGGDSGKGMLAQNRRARHEYHLLETFEAGIVLTGTEVKSARARQVSLQRSYVQARGRELYLIGANIAPYALGNRQNHEAERPRKLLLHRREANLILIQLQEKGVTVIPTKMYLKDGWIKVEIAIARGKKLFDKREDLKKRDAKRQVERALRAKYR